MELLQLALLGGLGAIVKDVVQDNCLVMPKFKDGTIILGCIGGIIIGMCVGYLVDNSPTTAFFSGYAGTQILESLVSKNGKE
jgi:fluoride ion exporter CrcB/FEX